MFLERIVEEMPFPIQRFQTDRGREFFATTVQNWMRANSIKFRPIKPRFPHLNGKVERSQKIDLTEFWAVTSAKDSKRALRLAEWQHYYNWRRPNGSLNGKTPMDVFFEKIHEVPLTEDIATLYNPRKERFREADYRLDLQLQAIFQEDAGTPKN